MKAPVYDLAIIGGGINGCGIARDAAGRGLSVFLCEQHDLASGTSSASTKLIHGGLRYLEYYEFRLVREALTEREVLLKAAPHIIWPLRFVLPHHKGLRPGWLIRIGLFLYDHLGGRKLLPGTSVVNLRTDEAGTCLKGDYTKGFEYSDCWVMDARLVALNAIDAKKRGAEIRTRSKCISATREGSIWNIVIEDSLTGETETIHSKVLVNASGPWLDNTLSTIEHKESKEHIRMVKGSHIIVNRLFDHPRAYIFQNADGRIIFAIPYETKFTLIGTTDVDFSGEPGEVAISENEIDYLCEAASEYFSPAITKADVVANFSGIRPLFDDGKSDAKAATRDYVLKLDESNRAPLLSIYGGKITTYRKLSESVLEKLSDFLPKMGGEWTANAHLPGGDFDCTAFEDEVEALQKNHPLLPEGLATRLIRLYGTVAHEMCTAIRSTDDLGKHFGSDLYEFEVRHLIQNEWARSAEDILWRRTCLGLTVSDAEAASLQDWLDQQQP
ncbi:glycerol-3-phosphate dehydrogenase [Desulfopila sp. IMCC35008]|uniref:glycerol-3-phosphate dehydrogenase n=1 Tax=Desulfopila sp. IMCC35008 TaxID=2653858 RepID=UPI0013D2E234|nr:glycerol-3-phosphate dehydrogenase [Desulfopila sp. IMCC35008]